MVLMPLKRLFLCLLLPALAGISHLCIASPITGRVVGVADGDTLTILDNTQSQHKVRIGGIDAPERRQPFGARSKKSLSELAFNEHVIADCPKKDRYGRWVCKVTVGGVDVGLTQIQRGMAWWYEKYRSEQVAGDQATYSYAQSEARRMAIGLWSEPLPMPPWDYRKSTRAPKNPHRDTDIQSSVIRSAH